MTLNWVANREDSSSTASVGAVTVKVTWDKDSRQCRYQFWFGSTCSKKSQGFRYNEAAQKEAESAIKGFVDGLIHDLKVTQKLMG
jgi:hypothetical protein